MFDRNKKYRVVIIDSGINLNHPKIRDDEVNGFGYKNGQIIDDFMDTFGHGTAIYSIIKNQCPSSDILNIKLFDIENSLNEDELIELLTYILNSINTDFIHMSLGINIINRYYELKDICQKICDKNIVMISAFDNYGSISYPAAFESVLGVSSSNNCVKISDFEFIDDSVINILAKGSLQKLAWVNPEYIFLEGNSFAAAHVTATALSFNLVDLKRTSVLEQFKKISKKQHYCSEYNNSKQLFEIHKAALFPFSKEMHSLIRYSGLLPFSIEKIYDTRYSMYVGSTTKHLLQDDSIDINIKIEKIDSIEWDAFDTIIIGHLRELAKYLGEDYQENFIKNALERGKNVYTFDDVTKIFDEEFLSSNNIYCPTITKANLFPNRLGKLHRISVPVLGVFGTSSKQGKYTLQLDMRQKLKKRGFSVGQIGTEPTALLFGMDYVFPTGYDSTVYINGYDSIRYLNHIINELSYDNDIVVVGSQSGTVSYDTGNLSMIPITQNEFLLGTQPDAVLLCINPYDEIEYIERTIRYIESITINCRVIGIVVFPVDVDRTTMLYNKRVPLTKERYQYIEKQIEDKFSLHTYLLGNEQDMEKICDSIELYFSEEQE